MFLACLVLGTETKTGTKVDWHHLHFSGNAYGCIFLTALSLTYLYRIKNGKTKPTWWKNLLLIFSGYLALPLIGLLLGMAEEPDFNSMTKTTEVALTLHLIYIPWFIAIALRKSRPRRERFKSTWWIPAFAALHYSCFFVSMILMAIMVESGAFGSAWLLREFNVLLRLPLWIPLTEGFIKQYLPGPSAHLTIMLNGLIFGTLAWLWFRHRNKNIPVPPEIPDLEDASANSKKKGMALLNEWH
jgi:hypothetical protein